MSIDVAYTVHEDTLRWELSDRILVCLRPRSGSGFTRVLPEGVTARRSLKAGFNPLIPGRSYQRTHDRHNRPITSHSGDVFVRAKFWTRLPRSRTNPALAPMSRAEPEHALARGLEGKKIRLKNNKLRL